MQHAKDKGWRAVLMLEDDVILGRSFLSRLSQLMSKLPDDWAALFLGGGERAKLQSYNDVLFTAKGVFGGYGYIVRDSVYEWLLNEWGKMDEPNDNVTMKMQSVFKCFKSKERLVIHIEKSYSDRQGKKVNY